MAKYKIVHYINQFFAGIGGEEIHDKLRIPILDGLQYDSTSFYFNFEC